MKGESPTGFPVRLDSQPPYQGALNEPTLPSRSVQSSKPQSESQSVRFTPVRAGCGRREATARFVLLTRLLAHGVHALTHAA